MTGLGAPWVLYFSHGQVALNTIDFWVGTLAIFVLATVQSVCFGWIFGIDKGLDEAHTGAQLRIPGVFRFVMKYVSPAYLLIVLIGFCLRAIYL